MLARSRLTDLLLASRPAGGTFYAIGGTWRALAKLHQMLRDYPLHMVQHYRGRQTTWRSARATSLPP